MATEKQIFNYKAKDPNGNYIENKIKAFRIEDVENELLSRGFTPLDIEETNVFSRDLSFGKKGIKLKEVAQFARQFATMTQAAVPIVRTLEILHDQSSNPTMKDIIRQLITDISNGSSLGDALAKHPDTFSQIMVSMVRAGESGGFLDKTLLSVAESLEAEVKLKAKIKSAMTYPVVIFILAIVMCIAMLLFIVPVFDDLFKSLGGDLPVPTQILVNLSEFLKVGAIPIAIAIGIFIFWWRKNKNNQKIREFIDPIKLKIPVFGKLHNLIIMSRFARNFGSLLDAAVPIVPVIDIVGTTTGSTVVEKALQNVRDSVLSGGTVAKPMADNELFPKMLVEMTAIGEDAGDMPNMLNKVADAYDDDVEAMTDSLTSLLEPIMLVFLGGVVGSMIVALYLPIFSVYDLVNK